jgi:hypothetical protein
MPLDVGVGIFLGLFVPPLFGEPVTVWLIAVGIAAALLPDIDMVPFVLKGQKTTDHRSWTHYPAVYIVLTAAAYVWVGPLYATLFALGVYLHLIHDTIGLGWGIAWLWPLSPRRFRFLCPTGPDTGMWELYSSWLPAEQPAHEEAEYDSHWVRNYYFRLNPIGVTEYGSLMVALTALYFFFY